MEIFTEGTLPLLLNPTMIKNSDYKKLCYT